METIKIKARLMKRQEPSFVTKAREQLNVQKQVQSRLKNGDLYDMKELERSIFDEDYYMREIQRFQDAQYLERQKYWSTEEGQARIMEMKYGSEKTR
ncbi:hypothetical protein FC702_05250 [Bacillus cereus]|nr:hypothetical protein FC702_05250 [Bacillus cereus]